MLVFGFWTSILTAKQKNLTMVNTTQVDQVGLFWRQALQDLCLLVEMEENNSLCLLQVLQNLIEEPAFID